MSVPEWSRSFAPPGGWGTRPYVFCGGYWVKILAVKRILLAILLACASLLPAQTRKPAGAIAASPSKLISIKVTGSKRYTPDQVIAATRLHPGQTVSEDDFKAVSRRLGESGAFSNVAYAFQFSSEGIKLDLQVTDSDPFVDARFENFVWLSDEELQEKLRARVPLFQGQLPVAGDLADQVSDALQVLAIERNLNGRADYLRIGPEDGSVEAFDFTITGQTIAIRKVGFSGAGPAELPPLESAARRLSGQDYVRATVRMQADKRFLPVFLERGYLKANIGEPQPKVVEETPGETVVDVTFPVTPGLQYKVSEVQLSGYTDVFPQAKLREIIQLKPGQVANAVQADRDVEALKKLYGTRGYVAAEIHPVPEMNDADSTVKYVFRFQEGAVYKMGDLEIRGLDSRATERMLASWRLLAGETYNSGYAKQFLDSIASLFPPDHWSIAVHESADDKDRLVDVSLHFDSRR